MAIEKEEMLHERKYLSTVKEVLLKLIEEANNSLGNRRENINDIKKFMWENLSDYTDEERAIALYEVDRSVDITNNQINAVFRYEKAMSSPYFGKVVFKDKKYDNEEEIYIGITSVQEGLNFYVFDWRAPISSMFYNYEVGKAKYQAPVGEIFGEIITKMQFKIVDGKLIRCFKSDLNIDDDYLQEILANTSTDKMKTIVSTIQREQNEVIRNERDSVLIVQSVAGSGKTSVGLHRIPFLMYRNKDLNSNNILIFSPNDVFSDYISNVLPELGEENVLTTTFSEFSSAYLKPYKNVESYSEFLERVYSNGSKDFDLISYKMSDLYKNDIDLFFENYEKNISFKNGVSINNFSVSATELNYLFNEKYKKFPLVERIEQISEFVCSQCKVSVKKYFSTIKKHLRESSDIIFNHFDLYKTFLNSSHFNNNLNVNSSLKSRINFEDITGLIYMFFKINGYPNNKHIKHIVIDEAQDYTKFQILLLKSIFDQSSFTILGDVNQTINPYYKYDSLSELMDIFPNGRYLELTKTYRSTEEIINYSNQILGIKNVCSVRKDTNVPVEFRTVEKDNLFNFLNKDLSIMEKHGINKIAIITRDVKQAIKLYDGFSKFKVDIQLISSSESVVKSSIIIIPSYLSKGLEFDGVIAYNDPQNSYEVHEKNLFYVVCTRAQHQLSVYNEPQKVLSKN